MLSRIFLFFSRNHWISLIYWNQTILFLLQVQHLYWPFFCINFSEAAIAFWFIDTALTTVNFSGSSVLLSVETISNGRMRSSPSFSDSQVCMILIPVLWNDPSAHVEDELWSTLSRALIVYITFCNFLGHTRFSVSTCFVTICLKLFSICKTGPWLSQLTFYPLSPYGYINENKLGWVVLWLHFSIGYYFEPFSFNFLSLISILIHKWK